MSMKSSKVKKNLGDLISERETNRVNIENRQAKGIGYVSQILNIITEIPLGHWYVPSGLRLRQAMLINGIMFNSEVWHSVTDRDMEILEKVDESLLRGILSAHAKTPKETLYLETKSVPLRYIIKSRRVMYLHSILTRSENELIKRVFEVQRCEMTKGDFLELVMKDISCLR